MISLLAISFSIIFIYALSISRKNIKLKLLLASFLYHFFFINLYYFIFLERGSDAKNFYFQNASNGDAVFSIGGQFIIYLMHFPIKYLNANFYDMSIIFGIIGYFGLLINYLSIKSYILRLNVLPSKVILLLLFLPGLNFWTAAPGKDSLIFFFISVFFYSLLNFKIKKFTLCISLLFIILVRPQIGAIFIMSLIIALFLQGKIKIYNKIFALFFLLTLGFIFSPYLLKYIGLTEASISGLSNYIDLRASYNTSGGSSIDISQSNIPVKTLGYLFRPLFFDIKDALGLFASIENIIYLLLFGYLALDKKYYIYLIKRSTFPEKFMALYFSIMAIVLASITANLGIAFRQKTMFITTLIFIFIIYKANHKKERWRKKYNDI